MRLKKSLHTSMHDKALVLLAISRSFILLDSGK